MFLMISEITSFTFSIKFGVIWIFFYSKVISLDYAIYQMTQLMVSYLFSIKRLQGSKKGCFLYVYSSVLALLCDQHENLKHLFDQLTVL